MKNRLETMLYNSIIALYDYNITHYKGLDDELFIALVCAEIGLSEEEYSDLIYGNTDNCEWNKER